MKSILFTTAFLVASVTSVLSAPSQDASGNNGKFLPTNGDGEIITCSPYTFNARDHWTRIASLRVESQTKDSKILKGNGSPTSGLSSQTFVASMTYGLYVGEGFSIEIQNALSSRPYQSKFDFILNNNERHSFWLGSGDESCIYSRTGHDITFNRNDVKGVEVFKRNL